MATRSVLILENDDAVVSRLRAELSGQAVTLAFARDTSSAIALLSQRQFCGLIVDLAVPDSGLAVLRHVEAQRLQLAAVVMAQALPEDVRDTLDDRYVKLVVPKPVDHRLLATIVLGLCGIPI